MTPTKKLIAAGLLFATWGVFAVTDASLVPGFIAAVRDALVALGVFTAALSSPRE